MKSKTRRLNVEINVKLLHDFEDLKKRTNVSKRALVEQAVRLLIGQYRTMATIYKNGAVDNQFITMVDETMKQYGQWLAFKDRNWPRDYSCWIAMKLKLNAYWTKKLLKYPETGMGYQKVDVVLKSGKTLRSVIVLNAEDLVLPDQYASLKLKDIADLIIQK